jgi:hypothetical protein
VAVPAPWLELFGVVTYQDDFRGEGHVDFTANGIRGEPLADCRARDPGTHCRLVGVRMKLPQTRLEATWGVRFAGRRSARTRTLEAPKAELWDLELQASWAETSHVAATRLRFHDDPGPQGSNELDRRPRIQLSSSPDPAVTSAVLPTGGSVPMRWRDTWTLRAGGDYNVLPGRLALRAGVSYATRAVPIETMSIVAWPVQKVGLHVGVTAAFGQYKLSLAYAHLFYQQIDVPLGSGQLKENVRLDPERANAINEGRYRAALDVVSLQLNTTF